jgi:hypothetical protein
MKLWCFAAAALLVCTSAHAQGVPRIKATVQSFDGQIITVNTGTGKQAQTMQVGITPATRYVREEKRALTDIATDNYIGATVTTGKDGVLHAQEVHVFPQELRGSSEGIFSIGNNRSMIDATVATVGGGAISVTFRGAPGADGPACTGRAPRQADQGCHGSATIMVAAGVPVTALAAGDKSMLVPGAILALSVMAGPDGRPVTPGLTLEGQAAPDAAPAPPSAAPHPAKPASR